MKMTVTFHPWSWNTGTHLTPVKGRAVITGTDDDLEPYALAIGRLAMQIDGAKNGDPYTPDDKTITGWIVQSCEPMFKPPEETVQGEYGLDDLQADIDGMVNAVCSTHGEWTMPEGNPTVQVEFQPVK